MQSIIPPRQRPAVAFAAALVAAGLATSPALASNFNDNTRWTGTATDGGGLQRGDAITLTWGIVPDGTVVAGGGRTSNFIASLDDAYGSGPGGSDLTQRPWFSTIADVFASYEGKLGVRYAYSAADDGAAYTANGSLGVRADVRLAALGSPFPLSGAIAYNNFPGSGGDMTVNSTPGTAGNFFANPAVLRGIMQHEHAHGLGLGHVTRPAGSTLPPPVVLDSGFNVNGPQYDDLLGLQRLYGDALELDGGNDTQARATNLGTVAAGSTVRRGTQAGDFGIAANDRDIIGIDGTSDSDYFKFTVTGRSQADLTLAPVGPTYDIQNTGGPTYTVDGQAQANLAFDVFDAAGTRIYSVDQNAVGSAESYTGLRLGKAGDYFVKVRSTQDANQFYRLDVKNNAASGGADPATVLADRFNGAATGGIDNVNATRLNVGRQNEGVIEAIFSARKTGPADGSVGIVNNALQFDVFSNGVDEGSTNQTVDVVRNLLPELRGQRWHATFDLTLATAGNVADGWFGLTFNDTDNPIGLPFTGGAEMSVYIRPDGSISLRVNNQTPSITANAGVGPYSFDFVVDETGATPLMSLLVNGIGVILDEQVALNDLGRFLSFTTHNGRNSDAGSLLTARLDNFVVAIPEPASTAVLAAAAGLLLRRRRRVA